MPHNDMHAIPPREQATAAFQQGWRAFQAGQIAQALPYYRQAIALLPEWYEPYYHAAVCHQLERRYAEAIPYYQAALERESQKAVLWYHYAKALKDCGQLDAALPAYQQALELSPDNSEILYSLGLLRLLRGEWLEGWKGYELRLQGSDRAAVEHRPATNLPAWRGEVVPAGSGLVVYAEQGIGDSIQCFRYARLLRQRFARVKFAVHAPLVSLCRDNAPEGVEVVPRVADAIDEAGYSHHVLMLSLPGLLGSTPQNVPADVYLAPVPSRQQYWQARFANERRPKVGLVWMGGKLTHAPGRDMAFASLLPLLPRTDICWLSLQKEQRIPPSAGVIDWMDTVGDFADTAALLACLDLVIAVDTAVAHLAGALGRPVWLLNRYESEWRWMHGKSSTPWYPTMRIFNQASPGDWDSVIRSVAEQLNLIYRSAAND